MDGVAAIKWQAKCWSSILIGVVAHALGVRRTLDNYRRAYEGDRARLDRYVAFVAGLAEAARRGVFPPELERHCQNIEIALKPRAGGGSASEPPGGAKPRQRSNAAQRGASPALVEGVPDRDGDGQPDKPPSITEVLAEVYDGGSPPADPADTRTAVEVIADRLREFDHRSAVFDSAAEYKRALTRLASEFVRLVSRDLDTEHLLDRAVKAELEVARLEHLHGLALDDVQSARSAVREANEAMLKAAAATSVAGAPLPPA